MKGSIQEILFPSFNYYLDGSDPDIVILRRQDDSFVAAFSAHGATNEGVIEAAKEDYRGDYSFGIIEPGERVGYGAILECLTPNGAYSPNVGEEVFSEHHIQHSA